MKKINRERKSIAVTALTGGRWRLDQLRSDHQYGQSDLEQTAKLIKDYIKLKN